ncbi:hypothetical protein CPC16_011582 [Podila verticillata]|nr:hypothetical protein CPC16_011582 [Podila verticillata]
MTSVSHFAELLLLLPIAFIFLTYSTEFVHAQSFSPISTGDSASVFVEGKAFYIQGGSTQQNTTNQTFSISLRYSWNTANPMYTKLVEGPYNSQSPNTLLNDGVTWFAISNRTYVNYNISDGKITNRGLASTYSNFFGQSAVFDRSLGEVIIPNGWANGLIPTTLFINPGNLSLRAGGLSDVTGLARYSLAWSESTQKAFLFGGTASSNALSGVIYQRNSSAFGNWNPINTTFSGTLGGPSPREAACMVPAFNGTKLIVFGGSGPTGIMTWNVALSDIFIYDVAKAEWTKGADAGSTRARAAHACAVSGDALIVWGGYSNMDVKGPAVEMIAIYNITANEWVDKFISPNGEPVPTSISNPNPIGTPGPGSDTGLNPESNLNTSGSGSNTGAIIGGVAGAVVVLSGLGFAVWRRGLLKKRTIFSKVHQQQRDGSHNFKEPAEQIRDPHSAPNVPPAPQSVPQNARHPQLRNPWQEQAHHQQSDEGLYDYRDPFARSNNPHGDLSEQRAPQIPPRPTSSFRGPQLDILRRERELAAELEMLRIDRGNTPQVQRYDNWSTHRSGNGSPHA